MPNINKASLLFKYLPWTHLHTRVWSLGLRTMNFGIPISLLGSQNQIIQHYNTKFLWQIYLITLISIWFKVFYHQKNGAWNISCKTLYCWGSFTLKDFNIDFFFFFGLKIFFYCEKFLTLCGALFCTKENKYVKKKIHFKRDEGIVSG